MFNTAIALGRLGVPVEFFSGLSSDLFGQQLARRAGRQQGRLALCAYFRRARRRSPSCGSSTATRPTCSTTRAPPAGCSTEADLPALGDDVDAMLFGAISLIPEPCGSTYEALMRREHGTRVMMLDPNIRPDFIPDRDKHLARMQRMMAMADIVKLSDEDLDWFGETGSADDVDRATGWSSGRS